MKTLKMVLSNGILIGLLTGCNGASGTLATTDTSTTSLTTTTTTDVVSADPASTPSSTPTPTVTPTTTPTPDPTPTVTPTPTPTPSLHTFPAGTGVSGNPYSLETKADVQSIGDYPNAYYTLTQDIDMSGGAFQPISSFGGVIYGNNHQLYNMTISTTVSNQAAMFLSMSGTIVQVVLQNVVITSQSYSTAFAATLTGMISSCSVNGTITSPSGGNGFNTGTGNPVYVNLSGSGSVVGTTQSVRFNGNTVNNTI